MAKSLKVANQCLILQINVPGVAEHIVTRRIWIVNLYLKSSDIQADEYKRLNPSLNATDHILS